MKPLLSRKFLCTLLVIFLAYGLVFAGKLPAKEWLEMATLSLGLYQVSNTATKLVNKK